MSDFRDDRSLRGALVHDATSSGRYVHVPEYPRATGIRELVAELGAKA